METKNMFDKTFSGKNILFILMILFLPFSACDKKNDGYEIDFEYNLRKTEGGWEAFFAGFNVDWEQRMELESGYRKLPEPMDTEDYGHFISARNLSDDVIMLFRRQVEGLEPNTTYNVGYTIRFATEVPSGCAGIGGAPGEAVKVIANGSQNKPEAVIIDNYYHISVQYNSGNPGEWYRNAIMGDIANSRECEEGYEYEIKEVSSGPFHDTLTADENGRAWLMFGTRSGFEGRTNLYYTYFKAEFRR